MLFIQKLTAKLNFFKLPHTEKTLVTQFHITKNANHLVSLCNKDGVKLSDIFLNA